LEGRLTFVNQRFLDLFKADREDVILQDRSTAQPPELAEQLREHDRLVIEAGKALQFEEVIEVEGVRQTYLSVKFPLHNEDGSAYALCGISADISDRKQAEKEVNERSAALQFALTEISQLTYSVSHEMGSPLRGVIGNIRFLREELAGTLDPQADHRLQRVERAALKMAQLVDDLLAYSRLGRHELQFVEIDFTDTAEHILSKMMQETESWRESIVEVDDDISFVGDTEMVVIALKALLENAYKFKKPDALPRIRIRRIPGGFSISDDGIGFDMQYAHKILRPFERLHRDNEYAGTGIGLAKVHRIAELHGGRIWAESEPGKGSTFFVQFSSEVPAIAL
jgi:light-regulated signal transduction histidine kinase (bacteriophytochrome)